MRYHNITKDDMLNGYGIRTVLWLAGCGHHCPGCQNPVTHDPYGGIPFDNEAKKELFNELCHDYIDGITFSGGDPLHPLNVNGVGELIKEIKSLYPTKTIWLYTGYTFESIKGLEFLPLIDVLCDGRFDIDKLDKNAHWVGSTNQRVIDVKKTFANGCNEIILYKDGSLNEAYSPVFKSECCSNC